MKKLLLAAVILSLLLISPVRAQDPIWLPLIVRGCGEWPTMSDWKVVVPESTTNFISHPSVEDADITAFVISNGATRARSNAQSRWGLYSLAITPHAVNNQSGVYYQITGTATTTYTFSVWVYGEDGVAYRLILIDGVPAVLATQTFTGTGGWQLVEMTGTTGANTTVRCNLVKDTGGGAVFYADGWQLEQKAYRTTYCDGDREGSEWNGAEHASTSSRSAQSRAGGRVRDLQTDYDLDIGGMIGAGTAPQTLSVDEYALLPGGELSGVKTHPRSFTLVGVIRGTSYADLHAKRQALVLLFDPDGMPEDEDGPQPVRLRYTGAAVQKQIAAHYETGLEGSIQATDVCWWERVAIRFLADDPFWYEIGESAMVLDSNDSATFRLVAGRLRDTGQWDELGPPAAPGTAAYVSIQAIAVGHDGTVYFGGEFANFNNNNLADYIVQYNPLTGTWSALADGLNHTVHDIAVAPDGDLYIVGEFTTSGTGAPNTYPYIVRWDVSAQAWAAVGVGLDGVGLAATVGPDGNIYIGGTFTDIFGGGGGTYNRIIQWNPITSTWAALGAGLNNAAYSIAVHPNNNLIIGGNFTDLQGGPGGTYNRVIEWNIQTSAWSALGNGFANVNVEAVAVANDGIIYAGGAFTIGGGSIANYLAMYRGVEWEAFSAEPNGIVYSLEITPDGYLYVGGAFTQIGSDTLPDRIVKWNRSTFAHLDIDLPGVATVFAMTHARVDPVIPKNYDLYLGFHTTGTGYYAGVATVTNDGSESVYPRIVIERSGGTSATLEMARNETTGKELLFDYDLLDGETLTIDLTPTEKDILSDFWGSRMDAILPACDFGTFVLQPSSNRVTCFVNTVGGPTITAYAVWQDAYRSYD